RITKELPSVAVVGRGRLGTALSTALRASGVRASEPMGRNGDPGGVGAGLLCAPDARIPRKAAARPARARGGHSSRAAGPGAAAPSLDVLAPHERFSLHPLMTFTAGDSAERFAGAGAAIAGSTARALRFARQLAEALEMQPFELDDSDRAAYHAAASIASNF